MLIHGELKFDRVAFWQSNFSFFLCLRTRTACWLSASFGLRSAHLALPRAEMATAEGRTLWVDEPGGPSKNRRDISAAAEGAGDWDEQPLPAGVPAMVVLTLQRDKAGEAEEAEQTYVEVSLSRSS